MTRLSPDARRAVASATPRAHLTADGARVGLDVEVARTVRQRTVGLLGRREVSVALLLHPCSSVHSLGMRIDLEVAYLDRDLRVLQVVGLPRWRVHRPRRHAAAVLEAAPGELTRVGVRDGAVLGLERSGPVRERGVRRRG